MATKQKAQTFKVGDKVRELREDGTPFNISYVVKAVALDDSESLRGCICVDTIEELGGARIWKSAKRYVRA